MKTSTRSLITACTAIAVAGIAAYSHLVASPPAEAPPDTDRIPTESDAATVGGAGVSGSLHFTDERGNRRNPTAAEARAAARAFQNDLDRLAGPHKDKPNVRTLPNGAVAATVATSRLTLLTAEENADGTLTYSHPTTDDDGNVSTQPATDLPEM